MAPSKIRKALGTVKDTTSIGLAKVVTTSSLADLDIAIVKATRHDELPAEEKHIREILSLTRYSRAHVSACVAALSRRLGKTRSWAVALKALVLVQRVLAEGDPTFEQEMFFATRRGTRVLNMSDFRDTSSRAADAWDFSAFVRTYALYLDERLDYRMHGRRARRSRSLSDDEDVEEVAAAEARATPVRATPVRAMETDKVFLRAKHLQQLMDRFLSCRPTGAAKANRIVAVALYPLVKESYQLYFDLQDIMSTLVDRFMKLDVPACARIHDIFCRLAQQFDDLDRFYTWCKSAGVSRPSELPDVERIAPDRLDLMEEFIRAKPSLSKPLPLEPEPDPIEPEPEPEPDPEEAHNIQTLSAPEIAPEEGVDHKEETNIKEEAKKPENVVADEDADFLNLRADVAIAGKEHGDQLALALFDGPPAGTPAWEAFSEEGADWEKALVVSASALSGQQASLGGGFDMALLDGMYSQPRPAAAQAGFLGHGSASSVALPSLPGAQPMLALPAPAEGNVAAATGTADPFAASLVVPAPSYVQMSEMQKKQQLLVEEQLVWQQYAKDGMQGQLGLSNLQNGHYPMGGGYTSRMS